MRYKISKKKPVRFKPYAIDETDERHDPKGGYRCFIDNVFFCDGETILTDDKDFYCPLKYLWVFPCHEKMYHSTIDVMKKYYNLTPIDSK